MSLLTSSAVSVHGIEYTVSGLQLVIYSCYQCLESRFHQDDTYDKELFGMLERLGVSVRWVCLVFLPLSYY